MLAKHIHSIRLIRSWHIHIYLSNILTDLQIKVWVNIFLFFEKNDKVSFCFEGFFFDGVVKVTIHLMLV